MNDTDPQCLETVRRTIDSDEVTDLARQLVAVPSYAADHGWEAGVAQLLEERLSREGLTVRRQPAGNGRVNVLAMLPGEHDGPPLLMLNGHMDTVPPPASTASCPFLGEVRDGWLWGRGSADMKGGLAAMAMALIGLRRSEARLPRPVMLAAVVAEETGNLGTAALLSAQLRPSFAVVGEPTALAVVVAHKGVDRYRITVRGRAAHGSTPERGINAILLAARLILTLENRLAPRWRRMSHPLLGSPTYNIGTIHGGTSRNTVPDRCTFQIEKRWLPGDSPEQIRADLEGLIARTLGPGAADVTREPEFDRVPHPPLELPVGHPLAQAIASSVETVLARPAAFGGYSAFTDAAVLQSAGVPAVVFGPGDISMAHADDERIPLAELYQACLIYVSLALRLAARERRSSDAR